MCSFEVLIHIYMENVNIVKTCLVCKKTFITDNKRRRFCCERCNAAYYHQVRKSVHAYLSLVEADMSKKLHYTVKETAYLLDVSVQQVYRLIKKKKLSVLNLGPRETLVTRKSIDFYKDTLNAAEYLSKNGSYTLQEVMSLTNLGQTSAYNLIKLHGIRKIRFKKFVGYNKEDIDALVAELPGPKRAVHWLTFKEVCNLLNSEDEYQVMFFLVNFRIPRRKRSGLWYFQKEEIVDKNQESHKRFNISM